MNFGDIQPSKNYVDDTWMSKMYKYLMGSQYNQQKMDDQEEWPRGAPGGYSNWLNKTLSDVTPEEMQMMQQHGMTLDDLYVYRAMKRGMMMNDPSAPPIGRNLSRPSIGN